MPASTRREGRLRRRKARRGRYLSPFFYRYSAASILLGSTYFNFRRVKMINKLGDPSKSPNMCNVVTRFHSPVSSKYDTCVFCSDRVSHLLRQGNYTLHALQGGKVFGSVSQSTIDWCHHRPR